MPAIYIVSYWKQGWSMVYLPGNEAARAIMNWNKWHSQLWSYPETKKLNFWLNLNRRNARIYKTYLCLDGRYIYLLFEECHQEKKNICLYPEIGQSFEESTRGVKYLDIFIEFGFCMMWRIILEAVIHLCLITYSSICIILYIINSSVKSNFFC